MSENATTQATNLRILTERFDALAATNATHGKWIAELEHKITGIEDKIDELVSVHINLKCHGD